MNKLILGGLAAVAAIAAVPSVASAAPSTCTYSSATRTMDVRFGAGQTSMTIKNGSSLLYSDGTLLRSCFEPTTGKVATAINTDKVKIKGVSGTGAQAQTTILDETAGGFPESNPNLHFFVLTGTNDRLVIKEGAGKDNLRLTDGLGPIIDLNYDFKDDVTMTTSNSIVEVDAGGGADLIDASTVRFYKTFQVGEDGDDALLAGTAGDSLFGGNGNDVFFAKNAVKEAVLAGGAGTDTATIDPFDVPNAIETLKFS
jgi:Ca2+-binding RTX toxin-like protein